MLTFTHPDQNKHEHRWPFVYFHGVAEDCFCLYDQPDMVVGSESMANYKPGLYPCSVDGNPGIVAIAERWGAVGGRIALTSDEKALNHILKPDDWR
jgi:hypothetical protein